MTARHLTILTCAHISPCFGALPPSASLAAIAAFRTSQARGPGAPQAPPVGREALDAVSGS